MYFLIRFLSCCILFTLILIIPCYTQETHPPDSKLNPISVYGAVGLSGAWATASGYIEFIPGTKSIRGPVKPLIRGGIAAATGFAIGTHIAIEGGVLIGRRNSYFEFTGGWHYGISEWYDFIPVGGSAGYRFQKPGGHFIFRTGIGYTEGIYAGIGLSF
jgi:hypothetical protein